MYYVLIGVQLLAIAFSIFSTILLIRLQSSLENRYLFICAISIDIYAVGYLQEMLIHTEDGIRIALSFEYCGASALVLLPSGIPSWFMTLSTRSRSTTRLLSPTDS